MILSLLAKSRQIAGKKTITEPEIREIQSFYDKGNSLRACQAQYGYCRETLIKNLITRHRPKLDSLERKKRNSRSVVHWRVKAKQKLVEYKGGKCKICGYNKYIGNLAFHHLDPSKKSFRISGKSISLEKLKCEVDKCQLLCHNCHGELHAGLIKI